jgi:hypothetical protein
MEKDRFTSKDGFIKLLPNIDVDFCAIQKYKQDNTGASEYNGGDKLLISIGTIIHPDLFCECLQGFANIGIDSSMRVKATFKLVGCIYNCCDEYIISFPASKILTHKLKWFLCNAITLFGQEQFQQWCSLFSTNKVFRGRKRQIDMLDEIFDTNWLLNGDQVEILLKNQHYLQKEFTDASVNNILLFGKGFSFH